VTRPSSRVRLHQAGSAAFLGFWLLVLAALASAPAQAAAPVRRLTQFPSLQGYNRVAEMLGATFWGSSSDNERVTHIILRTFRTGAMITIGLPTSTSPAHAERWLQETAAELGWDTTRLTLYHQPNRVLLTAHLPESIQQISPLRRRAMLDLPRLQRRLERLTQNPAVLCVRAPDADLYASSPPPAAQGKELGSLALFYRLSGASTPLSVEYGIPGRWLTGLAAALLLWGWFPLLPGLLLRRRLVRQERLTSTERLGRYRRWLWAIRLLSIVGAAFTLSAFDLERLGFLAPAVRSAVLPLIVLLIILWFWHGLLSSLMAMPLRQTDHPVGAMPMMRLLARGDIVVSSFLLLIILAIGYFTLFGATAGRLSFNRLFDPVLLIGGGAYLLWIFVAIVRTPEPVRPDAEPLPSVPEDLEGMRQAFPELLAYAERERARPAVEVGSFPGSELVAMYERIGRELDLDQHAALCATAALVRRFTRRSLLVSRGGMLTAAVVSLGAGCITLLLPTADGGSFGLGALPVLLGVAAIIWVSVWLSQRLLYRHLETADVKAAQLLDDPERYLAALRTLARHEQAIYAENPLLPRTFSLAQRIARLERRLSRG